MNTSAKALLFAVIAVTSAAAIGTGLADMLAPAQLVPVVQLERVTIVGQRADAAPRVTAQLPRVVILGRSTATAEARLVATREIDPAL